MYGSRRSIPLALAIVTAAIALPGTNASAQDYPRKPITMWIGFRPGGSVDTTGRLLATKLEKILGQPVVAVTKAGGGGTVMATQLKSAKPDGYTIGMGASAAYALTPQLNKEITYKIEDFQHIATLTQPEDAIVVEADSKWNSLKDMLDDAKASGRALSMTYQVAASRLMAMAISEKSGVQFKLVPVNGGAAGIQSVLGGQVDVTWSGSGWSELARAGKLKPLASMGDKRNQDFPKVPTLEELGFNFAFTDTFMLSAPKGLPPAVLNTLSAAVEKAIKDPEVQAALHKNMHLDVSYRDPKATVAFLHKQHDAMAPLVAKLK
ncbi:MAG TPA: tripartite tricarboxylate transporter substrate binding protein [Pseudolabrys sp.]|nr:tripartite tricarboxylate transporter substrate binding protein [Pseudolabrys sp.]